MPIPCSYRHHAVYRSPKSKDVATKLPVEIAAFQDLATTPCVDAVLSPRKTRLRKLGKEAQLLFNALSLSEAQPKRPRKIRKAGRGVQVSSDNADHCCLSQSCVSQRHGKPLLACMLHEHRKGHRGRIRLKCDRPPAHTSSLQRMAAAEKILQAVIHKVCALFCCALLTIIAWTL